MTLRVQLLLACFQVTLIVTYKSLSGPFAVLYERIARMVTFKNTPLISDL
jgi:hypothetical protein